MEIFVKALLALHVIAGFISLVFFWLPIFTKKGSKKHLLYGRIYIKLMWVVVSSAAILSIKNLLIGHYSQAAFLGFLALITANPLWYGISIFKQKKGGEQSFLFCRFAFHTAIVMSAMGLILYGFYLDGKGPAIVMFIFGGLGLTDIPNLVQYVKKVKPQRPAVVEHIVAMITTGIAAYTAFFVFGAGNFFNDLLSGYWSILPWVAPGIIGTFGIRYAVARYEKRKIKKPSAPKGEMALK